MDSHVPSLCMPGPSLTNKCHQTPQVKNEPEELIIKLEEELPALEYATVFVKKEEASPHRQRQTQNQYKTQQGDVSSEAEYEIEIDNFSDFDEDWVRPLSSAESSTETEDDKDHSELVHIRGSKSALETRALENDGLMLGTDGRAGCKKNYGENKTNANEGEGSMKYQCPVCKVNCKFKYRLRQHIRVHTGEKPFSCSVCLKRFSQSSGLNAHKKTHSSERPFSCSVCNKTFNCSQTLQRHQRIHNDEKPYSCAICEKTFRHSGQLSAHMRLHTGEKPYSCTVCKKSFRLKCPLKVHMRIHTGERPFSCTLCMKTFVDKSALSQHLKSLNHANKLKAVQSERNICSTVSD